MFPLLTFGLCAFIVLLNAGVAWLFIEQPALRKRELALRTPVILLIILQAILLFLSILLANIFHHALFLHTIYIFIVLFVCLVPLTGISYIANLKWRPSTRTGIIICVFTFIAALDLFWYSRNHELPYPRAIYAEGYTKSKFLQVEYGMKYEDVIALLGEPLETKYTTQKLYYYGDDKVPEVFFYETTDIEQHREEFEAAKKRPLPGSDRAREIEARGEPEEIITNTSIELDYVRTLVAGARGGRSRQIHIDEEKREVLIVRSDIVLRW